MTVDSDALSLLIVMRVYSGHRASFTSGKWEPEGQIPMVEFLGGLDRNNVAFDALVLEKEPVKVAAAPGEYRFPDFRGRFLLLGYPSFARVLRRIPGAGRLAQGPRRSPHDRPPGGGQPRVPVGPPCASH